MCYLKFKQFQLQLQLTPLATDLLKCSQWLTDSCFHDVQSFTNFFSLFLATAIQKFVVSRFVILFNKYLKLKNEVT